MEKEPTEEENGELLKSIKEKLSNEIDIIKLRVQQRGKTAFVVVDIDIKNENIEKDKINNISNIIKDSVKEKYELNHTFINVA